MIRSASGTYSLPSACMKSYWVSTSQKTTRAMAGISLSTQERVNREEDNQLLEAQTHRGEQSTGAQGHAFLNSPCCSPLRVCASSRCLFYNLRLTATSSQQLLRGHLVQSAHTLSGKCSRSAGAKPSLKKKSGLRVRARISLGPCARASRISVSSNARPRPAPCQSERTASPATSPSCCE